MSSKFALVIANMEYQDASFAKLTAPGKDGEEFAEVLRQLAAFDEVQVLLNEGEGNTRRSIARFFADRKRDDLLLLYFSGHGIRNEQGQLFLAARDTEVGILEASGIPAEFISYAMNNSRSQRQLLILDCCNSGAFSYGTKAANVVGGSMGIATAFEGSGFGRVVLTATDATQYAWEGDKVIGNTQKSVFTHFLIEGLRGDADRNGDGRIDIDELYDYAYEQVVRSTPKQTPGKWSYKQQGDIILRENLPPKEVKPAPLPTELIDLLSHPNPNVRKVGIQELIRLIDGANLALALAAQNKLREIEQDDDSLTLRKMARTELEARARALEKEITNHPSMEITSGSPVVQDSPPAQIPEIDDKQDKEMEPPVLALPHTGAPIKSTALPTPTPKITIPNLNWRILGGIGGGLLVITLCTWGIVNLWNNFPAFLPKPTPTFTPILTPALTPTKTITSATNTPSVVNLTKTPTPTLPVGSTIIGKAEMILLYVPASEFTMGSGGGGPDEEPIHLVYLDGFWISKTEVTNKMYSYCVAESGCQEPTDRSSSKHPSYYGNAEYDNYPVIYVDWNMAKAYCEWANLRLPTEAEWEKAARGTDALTYPWGNDLPNNGLLNYDGAVGDTSEVGKYPDGASPYGALDMAGNVWEWVADWYGETYYASLTPSNPLGPDSGENRVARGGSWVDHNYGVRTTRRNGIVPTGSGSNIGFRCARSLSLR